MTSTVFGQKKKLWVNLESNKASSTARSPRQWSGTTKSTEKRFETFLRQKVFLEFALTLGKKLHILFVGRDLPAWEAVAMLVCCRGGTIRVVWSPSSNLGLSENKNTHLLTQIALALSARAILLSERAEIRKWMFYRKPLQYMSGCERNDIALSSIPEKRLLFHFSPQTIII